MINLYKHIAWIYFIGFLSFVSFGLDTFEEGVQAHKAKNFELAIEKFTETIEQDPKNVSAFYNLGVSNIGAKDFGGAIWAFEKVLKFNPNDSETKEKIEFCQAEINPNEYWTPILNGFQSGLYSLSSNTWSTLAVFWSCLICISIIVFRKNEGLSLRRLMIVLGFFSTIFMMFCVVIAIQSKNYQTSSSYAIVTKESIPTLMTDKITPKSTLSAGTRVQLLHEDSGLQIVKTTDGEEHLVNSMDIAYI